MKIEAAEKSNHFIHSAMEGDEAVCVYSVLYMYGTCGSHSEKWE